MTEIGGSVEPGYEGVADAFRLMQASGHIGKLVLTPDNNAAIRLPPPAALALRADGTYLVTGGLSGFGFAAARWLEETYEHIGHHSTVDLRSDYLGAPAIHQEHVHD